MLNNVKIFHIKQFKGGLFVTLSENKTLELTKSIFSLIFIYIGIEFLAIFILVPISLVLNLVFKTDISINFHNDTTMLTVNCITQILGIYFFTKTYRKKEFNVPKINNPMSLNAFGKYALISLGDSGISILWLFLVQFISKYSPLIKSSLQDFIEHNEIFTGNTILAFISVVIFAPIVEEIIFRGIIFNEVAKYKGGAFPIIISALLFGLAHMQPIQIVYTFISGLIWAFVYSKTHSLPIVMFLHMLNNLLTFAPEPLSTFISIIQVLSIIPMIYLLRKLYKESKV
ncbi:lysostaphin resistance A-like protein [Clostridium perfringens]|uniref:CPBP family intramembrane glutamic endopeptidase n=1 Tax=Clostridium perfringens TaxID=1502 RepID=UPI001F3D0478|nr:CPBP family intramembrane glutamic endopeptidase [Clostridium perfringens]MDK7589570.1 CPBP family intramembrane metalloprotease [Clostridium sp. UMB9555B]